MRWQHEAFDIQYHASGQAYIRILGNISKKNTLPVFISALDEFKNVCTASEPPKLHMIYEMIYIPKNLHLMEKQWFAFETVTHCAVVCKQSAMISILSNMLTTKTRKTINVTKFFTCVTDAQTWLKAVG